MSDIRKQHGEFLEKYKNDMAKAREPLHKVATSHQKALHKIQKKPVRYLSEAESAEKKKHLFKGPGTNQKEQMHKDAENLAYQNKFKRAWND